MTLFFIGPIPLSYRPCGPEQTQKTSSKWLSFNLMAPLLEPEILSHESFSGALSPSGNTAWEEPSHGLLGTF
jgi:hypothetical protein